MRRGPAVVARGGGGAGWLRCRHPPTHRLYCAEAERSSQLSQRLGLGIAAFQGLSNLALNGEWPHGGQDPRGGGRDPQWGRTHKRPVPAGIVLGTIFVGGSLMAGNELSPGDLMSFLVASQTVQR